MVFTVSVQVENLPGQTEGADQMRILYTGVAEDGRAAATVAEEEQGVVGSHLGG